MSTLLSPRQLQAVQLIASGKTQRQTSEDVGVTYQTVSGWMQKPEFVVEVNKITSTVHEATATVLQGLRLRAVEVLGALLEADSAAIKLQAVRMVLEASAHPVRNSAANSTLEFIERQLGSSHEFTKEELDSFLQ
jgi:DNA-binding CsgD family transcriptional regulator